MRVASSAVVINGHGVLVAGCTVVWDTRGMGEPAVSSVFEDAQYYDLLALLTAPADLPLYLQEAARLGGPILELGCGTGRLTIPLASAGYAVAGIDLSPNLLQAARAKADRLGLSVELSVGDMRELDLGRTFRLVIIPYNTFNCLLDRESLERCLQVASRHMGPESRLLIDTFNPSPAALGAPPRDKDILELVDPGRRQAMVLAERNDYDPARQVNHITWTLRTRDGGEVVRVDELDMRILFPQELDALLHHAGLVVERKLGGYDGREFAGTSSKQLMVCRLP